MTYTPEDRWDAAADGLAPDTDRALATIRDALGWHEYGSQDERRAKALPALDTLESEISTLERQLEEARKALRDLRTYVAKYPSIPDLAAQVEKRITAAIESPQEAKSWPPF